jgi:hypothetical protein
LKQFIYRKSKGGDRRNQQLAHFEDPAVQRCSADFQADISFQNHALPMQQ